MADTLATVRGRVRVRIDEPSARFWQDGDLNQWINEAARDIARRTETLEDVALINSVGGTQQYTLTSSTLRVYRVEWCRDGDSVGTIRMPLEYKDFGSMDSVWWTAQSTSRGDPFWYTLWGFPPSLALKVYPTPDVTVTGAFKVYYYRVPAAASGDSDPVEVAEGWKDLIDDYCEFSALRKDGDPRWQDAKQLYEQKIELMLESTRRWTDQSDSVQGSQGFIPRWLWGGE